MATSTAHLVFIGTEPQELAPEKEADCSGERIGRDQSREGHRAAPEREDEQTCAGYPSVSVLAECTTTERSQLLHHISAFDTSNKQVQIC
jgi:hypothetical protein